MVAVYVRDSGLPHALRQIADRNALHDLKLDQLVVYPGGKFMTIAEHAVVLPAREVAEMVA